MLNREDIAKAVQELDSRADAGIELAQILSELDIDPKGATHVAEQRALRVVLLFEGWTPQELALLSQLQAPVRIPKLPPEQRAMIPIYMSVWLDGFSTGRKA